MLKDIVESNRAISQPLKEHNSWCNNNKAESLIEILHKEKVKENPAKTTVIPE